MTTPGPILASGQRAITEALQAVPANQTGAVVAVATPQGVKLAVAARVGDRWRFGAWLDAAPEKPPDFGVAVQFTW